MIMAEFSEKLFAVTMFMHAPRNEITAKKTVITESAIIKTETVKPALPIILIQSQMFLISQAKLFFCIRRIILCITS